MTRNLIAIAASLLLSPLCWAQLIDQQNSLEFYPTYSPSGGLQTWQGHTYETAASYVPVAEIISGDLTQTGSIYDPIAGALACKFPNMVFAKRGLPGTYRIDRYHMCDCVFPYWKQGDCGSFNALNTCGYGVPYAGCEVGFAYQNNGDTGPDGSLLAPNLKWIQIVGCNKYDVAYFIVRDNASALYYNTLYGVPFWWFVDGTMIAPYKLTLNEANPYLATASNMFDPPNDPVNDACITNIFYTFVGYYTTDAYDSGFVSADPTNYFTIAYGGIAWGFEILQQ